MDRWPPKVNTLVYYHVQSKPCLCKVIKFSDGIYVLKKIGNEQLTYKVDTLDKVFLYGRWKEKEKEIILHYYSIYVNKWSTIASFIKWRTPQQIRSHMQKMLKKMPKYKRLTAVEKIVINALQLLKNK